ncbi:hypothetical protein M8J77_019654 [Diaphorina citri]|nr:hypothetical protein M8J77_019654 [Diaphorina citri]
MDESEEYFSNNNSSCSSDFDKCSYSSSSGNFSSNNSSLCSQENCNIINNNNNNLVNINNEFSNKCDVLRNLVKSSSSNDTQTLITDFMKIKKNPQNFVRSSCKSTGLSNFHGDESFDLRK